jgi:DNA repair protein SbcD/Mre11
MPPSSIRVLFLADTHLGIPGHFEPFERALEPAFRGEVDLVIHGGDVFYRSRVKPNLVFEAFARLKLLADAGVPVVVVPGNHERSAIPYPIFAAHPGIHIFDRPRTFKLTIAGICLAVAGFPNDRDAIAAHFSDLMESTGWRSVPSDIRILCMHQTVEGAKVGPVGFTFRRGPDVIPGPSVPAGFAAVLSGHIHRQQVLTADLDGRPLAAPVFYPGSTERTSGAERYERKGFLTMRMAGDSDGGRICEWNFHELSAPLM